MLSALAAAKQLPQLSLLDALELTVLVVRKDPDRYQRVEARWLLRYVEEHPAVTIEEAVQTLRAMAETANSRRQARVVA